MNWSKRCLYGMIMIASTLAIGGEGTLPFGKSGTVPLDMTGSLFNSSDQQTLTLSFGFDLDTLDLKAEHSEDQGDETLEAPELTTTPPTESQSCPGDMENYSVPGSILLGGISYKVLATCAPFDQTDNARMVVGQSRKKTVILTGSVEDSGFGYQIFSGTASLTIRGKVVKTWQFELSE